MALLASAVFASGCAAGGPAAVRVRLAGGQIPVEFVEAWLGQATEPPFAVEQVGPIHLSMHGFDNLRVGKCDLACTDRPLKRSELAEFGPRRPAGRRVGFYGYALYVNTANQLDALFTRHMRLVFQQRIKDWSELAGPALPTCAGPIRLFGPPKDSRGGMVLAPLANIFFAEATWQECPSDAQTLAQVAADPLALGFAEIGYDGDGVRYLGLRSERLGPPALPALEAIEQERYPLAKVIYVYWVEPATPAVQAAVDYLFSEPGQRAIAGLNVRPVAAERAEAPPPP